MLWQPCEVEWIDDFECERQGIVHVLLIDGDSALACVECAQALRIERAALVTQ
jgi:hypothetical protein